MIEANLTVGLAGLLAFKFAIEYTLNDCPLEIISQTVEADNSGPTMIEVLGVMERDLDRCIAVIGDTL